MKYVTQTEITIFSVLQTLFPHNSKTSLRQMIAEKRILVDGEAVTNLQDKLLPGQTLVVGPRIKFMEEGIKILYDDRDIVIIEKPSGLLSVATNFEKGATAEAYLKNYYYPRPVFPVHRLDQETSGVMAFALSYEGKEGMKGLFMNHDIIREYAGIVEGQLMPPVGTWTSYLVEDAQYKVHAFDEPERGQIAITHYCVEKMVTKFSRVKFQLETGRKNQIRVQCQKAGHPIVGDKKYGAQSKGIRRLALHAEKLEFTHPLSKKKLRFNVQAPKEFDKLVS